MASNKITISADFENVVQGHRLRKSLYHGSYMTDFNQTFVRMTQLGAGNKIITPADLENVVRGHISQEVISELL